MIWLNCDVVKMLVILNLYVHQKVLRKKYIHLYVKTFRWMTRILGLRLRQLKLSEFYVW